MSIEIRLITADDDLGPDLDLARRAFGPFGADVAARRLASARATVDAGQHLAAFDGATMVASARYFDMRQWWHGRSLPMAGIAGVKVAPEERGRGVGRALMTGMLEQIAARGYPLATLYPATSAVYRSVGWEVAGGLYEVTLPSRSLRSLVPPDPMVRADSVAGRAALRRAGAADAARMIALHGELHAAARDCGPSTFDARTLALELDDEDIFCYLAPDGLLAYRWNRPKDEILVYRVLAGSGETALALWSVVASHESMVGTVRAFVSPADPVGWLVGEPDVVLGRPETWMLRLIDAPAAIAGRGFPDGASLAVPLSVRDAQVPANTGRWLLEISGGKGVLNRCEPEGSGQADAGQAGAGQAETGAEGSGHAGTAALRLGARGLAAMYAGTPLATLRVAGLAAGGDPGADVALDEAFAGTPYMLDYF